jgi:peptidoglycan/LPS O-acetylase OafA/YrhL
MSLNPAPISRRIESLDVLRSFAIILVFLSHYGIFGSKTLFQFVGQYGWAGVDLFFVLSGFLIASQLFKPILAGKTFSYRDFYLRRSFRILPSYLAVLALYWIFPHWREREVMAPFWKFLTFTTNFGLDFKHAGAFSHSWSLCVEEHFYLLLPILVALMARPRARKWIIPLIISVFIAGMVSRLVSWLWFVDPLRNSADRSLWYVAYFKRVYYPSYNRLDGLLAGVVIALIDRFRPKLWEKLTARGNLISLLGLGFLAVACVICHEETSLEASVFGYPVLALGFGSLVIAALSPGSFLSKMKVPGASTMALLSFTFYLTHKEIIYLLHRRFSFWGWDTDALPVFLATFGISLMASVLLHLAIERPFLRFRDQIVKKVVI